MTARRSSLDRFLHAVRRRLILIRLLETCGIFIACGCAFALVLSLGLLWLGRESMTLSAWTLAISAAAGALAGWMRRPTVFDAATEADRQLVLADLLATALAARDASDPWQQTIVALAQERTSTIAPSSVIAHRLGARAWGGIGLSAALVLTISALSIPTTARQATAVLRSPIDDRPTAPPLRESRETQNSPSPRTASPAADPSLREGSQSSSARESNQLARQGESPDGGTSQTLTQRPPTRDDTINRAESNSTDPRNSPGHEPGSDGGVAPANRTTAASGFTGSSPNATESLAPLQFTPTPTDRQAAESALRDRRVPDSARDVVSEYFRPD